MEQNVPRPSQVHSGTMKRPGMNFSRTKYVDVAIIFDAIDYTLDVQLDPKNLRSSGPVCHPVLCDTHSGNQQEKRD